MTLVIELQIKRFNLTARNHARLMRDINRRVMERQWSDRVPMHFEMSAYAEYGARKRAKATDDYKKKKRGHTKPNVFSGRLRRSMRHKITATQHGSKLTIRAQLRQVKQSEDASPIAKYREQRKQRRLATWQKREIAVLSRSEISEERKRQAREYRRGAMSAEYRRQRSKRIR